MPRKEINIFSVSFLDLLSGALAAVIILFILVPRMSIDQVRELEQLDALNMQLDDLEGLMIQLESSVDESLLIQVKEELTAIRNTVDELEEEIEQLRLRLANCEDERSALVAEVQELRERVAAMESRESVIEELQQKLADCHTDNENLEHQISTLEMENQALQDEVNLISRELQLCEEELKSVVEADVGFQFKGKSIVFAIDISGSMEDEGKLAEVKSGLKMLLTMMGPEFNIDVVAYPWGTIEYNALWGDLRGLTDYNRSKILEFIYNLNTGGYTPTRAVLKNCLTRYPELTDIILLSDGAPTLPGTDQSDDIYSIISEVNTLNILGIHVNTIGVGRDFLLNHADPKVVFLRELAQNNNGFFVGF